MIATAIESAGIFVTIVGGLVATFYFIKAVSRGDSSAYDAYRKSLGRSILLGLEFLVAGDIIGTVAVEPTFQSLGVLGLIVVIRTFLSFSLEVELEGHWPWQASAQRSAGQAQ